jgi:arsenite-transporting ATPase
MRVLLFAGKGGVGKTSVAAATALRAARLGHRTVAVSLDLAHSLSDSLDLDRRLLDDAGGSAVEVAERFSIQEIDVESELRRHWGGVHDYIAQVLNTAGLDQVVAEEVALLPGMAEVVGLLWLNKYRREQVYDLVVLDCAPTGESLRFLSMPTALEWYMDRVFKLERTLVRVARPFVSAFSDLPVPGDDYFQAIQALYDRMEGVRELLEDPNCTSARVVTNAEKMVVRETRRAFMYIGLYGLNVDLVVANRILPDAVSDPHFASWHRTQAECLREIEESFAPVPVRRVPLFDDQIVGMARLDALAGAVYGDDDPTTVFREDRPWRFEKVGDEYRVLLRLPFATREDVDLSRSGDQLIVRIGSFKRHVTLPGSFVRMRPEGAEMQGDELCITFGRDDS